eukprot:SAG11_NODE_3972_length_2127_cov_5.802761_1_plen_280_part_00
MHRADEDLAAARAAADDAQDMVDALDAKAVCADALVEQAQAGVRAAEEGAEWIRAVAAVARQRREQRRVAADSAGASAVARSGVADAGVTSAGVADAGVTSAGVLVKSALVPSVVTSALGSSAFRFVAEEAAAEGAVRLAAGRTAAVVGTWLAALARERSRQRAGVAAGMDVASAPSALMGVVSALSTDGTSVGLADGVDVVVSVAGPVVSVAGSAADGVTDSAADGVTNGMADGVANDKLLGSAELLRLPVDVSQWSASWRHRSWSSRVFDPGGSRCR